ncbi:MAG: hypothetical protein AAF485_25425, partial [Chloroflexota bacterium]
MSKQNAHHVIILGCGRSGTSIFGELFDHLPTFTYYSEPPFAELLGFDFGSPVAVKVPKESPGYPPTKGLSFPLEQLLAAIPDPKRIYWQVRHPLDTICSLRVGIAQNWGHHPKPPDWQDWLERPLIERCAHHWNYLNSVGFEQVRHLANIKHFEQMIETPLQFAISISQDIGLDPAQHETSLREWAKRVQNTNNKHFVEAETSRNYSRPDHQVRIDRWKENLTVGEIDTVLPIIE